MFYSHSIFDFVVAGEWRWRFKHNNIIVLDWKICEYEMRLFYEFYVLFLRFTSSFFEISPSSIRDFALFCLFSLDFNEICLWFLLINFRMLTKNMKKYFHERSSSCDKIAIILNPLISLNCILRLIKWHKTMSNQKIGFVTCRWKSLIVLRDNKRLYLIFD